MRELLTNCPLTACLIEKYYHLFVRCEYLYRYQHTKLRMYVQLTFAWLNSLHNGNLSNLTTVDRLVQKRFQNLPASKGIVKKTQGKCTTNLKISPFALHLKSIVSAKGRVGCPLDSNVTFTIKLAVDNQNPLVNKPFCCLVLIIINTLTGFNCTITIVSYSDCCISYCYLLFGWIKLEFILFVDLIFQDLTSVQNLQKKHALLEADVGAHQVRKQVYISSRPTPV